MLNICETIEEVDEVFKIAGIYEYNKRCEFLAEKDSKYYDLPDNPKDRYSAMRLMWVQPQTINWRKIAEAKHTIAALI